MLASRMEQIIWFDLLIRGASIGVLLLLLARFLLHRPIRFPEIAFICLIVSVLAYVLASAPVQLLANDTAWRALSYLPLLGPFFLWWAGLAFFDDDFSPRPWHALPAALVLLPVVFIARWPLMEWLRTLVVFLLYGHLVYMLLKNRASDLVEERRRFRHWFILLAVLFGGAAQLVEVSTVEHSIPGQSLPFQAIAVFFLSMAFAFWALRISGANWQARPDTRPKAASPLPKDTRLLARLNAMMEDGIWQEEGLSVGGLAQRLDVPEHRLRRAINQGLGYRNFSTFVNRHRIDAACIRLADADKADIPVLAIAYEVGFSSIGPFNRAFRAFKGESPTAFRAKALANSG